MRSCFSRKRLIGGSLLVLVLGGAAALWWGRSALVSWYYVRQLVQAEAGTRESWAERVADLGEEVVPQLVACLKRQDDAACVNVRDALVGLAGRWKPDDPRHAGLRARLAEAFPQLSPAGQCVVLDLEQRWLPEGRKNFPGRLLTLAGRAPQAEIRGRALGLAALWLQHPEAGEGISTCRELVRHCLRDPEAANRAAAVELAVRPDIGLARQVAPLLDDPAPEVRKEAMAAIGTSEEAVATDDLLRSLHDGDADVRRLCELALRGRGLVRKEDLTLARLVSDAKPGVRLQVLERLSRTTDLEPGVWLRRLSQDPAPAVRAAAARAAADLESLDFSERLQKMAEQDPSPTVRQLARHYLDRHKLLQQNRFNR